VDKPRIRAYTSRYTLVQFKEELREHELRTHDEFTKLHIRLDKLAAEFRADLEKRVSLERYRPVEMLTFGAITLIFGALAAFVLGVLK